MRIGVINQLGGRPGGDTPPPSWDSISERASIAEASGFDMFVFEGEFYTARQSELVLRGPRPEGPPIVIAAGSPKMLNLAAKYADSWNWWGWGETLEQTTERLEPIISELTRACEASGRDPSTLGRTYDLYSVVPEGFDTGGLEMEHPVTGTSEEISEFILSLGGLGFQEVRCEVYPRNAAALAAMKPVVDLVHAERPEAPKGTSE